MVKNPRPGFHDYALEMPDVIWQKLCDESEKTGKSIVKIIVGELQARYKIPEKDMPKPRRMGRPPNR